MSDAKHDNDSLPCDKDTRLICMVFSRHLGGIFTRFSAATIHALGTLIAKISDFHTLMVHATY